MNIPDPLAESALLADIESLRGQFPQTQDLYREVCALMFFRYGITPTANKLYQLVRKGSMSAPAEALSRFWQNLRDKSRVVISHPDLPDLLKVAAGELAATLWTTAMTEAHESLGAFRQESQLAIDEAQAVRDLALASRDQVHASLQTVKDQLAVDYDQRATLRSDARHWRVRKPQWKCNCSMRRMRLSCSMNASKRRNAITALSSTSCGKRRDWRKNASRRWKPGHCWKSIGSVLNRKSCRKRWKARVPPALPPLSGTSPKCGRYTASWVTYASALACWKGL
jgi:hypothetical protein